jgi:hypothetical protein
VVAVAHREGVGERVVEGQVGAGVVAHGQRPAGGAVDGEVAAHEAVEPAAVPVSVLRPPAVADVVGALAVVEAVQPEWMEMAAAHATGVPGLGENRQPAAVAERRHRRVGEAAHPAQGPQAVVEGAVLLHQDDDVLDVGEPAAGGPRGERPLDQRVIEQRGGSQRHAAGGPRRQQLASGEPVVHGASPRPQR